MIITESPIVAPAACDRPADVASMLQDACALSQAGREREAAEIARRILAIEPDSGPAKYVLAATLVSQPLGLQDLEEAYRLALGVVARNPDKSGAHWLLAATAIALGRDEAQALLDSALSRLTPEDDDYPDARRAAATRRLAAGDLSAWQDYDFWTDNRPGRPFRRRFHTPRWDGGAIDGRRILVHAMEGNGDTIMAARFLPLLKATGAEAVLVCPRPLRRLLGQLDGGERIIPTDTIAPEGSLAHHVQAPIMALPGLLDVTAETLPSSPYLAAAEGDIERWRPSLASIPGFRVGVAWQGSPTHKSDRLRSFPLAELTPLAEVPGVSLVSLQKNHGAEQLADAPFPVVDLGPDYAAGDWMDTAAVVGHLDLVVSPDSAICHLAAALGKPIWTALTRPSEWRWMRDRDDSPWYPTMRLFRQDRLGEWAPVFRRMAEALGELVSGAGGG